MQFVQKIQELIESELDGSSHFIVEILGGDINKKVQVYLDGDEGVSIDVCSKVSRKIFKELEEDGIERGTYLLEISSPGLDRPLKMERQYNQHIGRNLEIELKEDNKVIEGKLIEVNNTGVKLNKTKKKVMEQIEFNQINETKVLISFN